MRKLGIMGKVGAVFDRQINATPPDTNGVAIEVPLEALYSSSLVLDSELNRIVNMYLDYAENQAKKQIPMKMKDWVEKLDAFVEFNEYEILQGI